ncbi:DUF6622 family protein [Caballeronia sp. BR00000012568055]|uniref:DUF6622 family protein n=1 Tax=Caballeronia sp. BR00000012568055 TaxID=2918761 RepID=UPI0023F9BBC8|nr:DUF6622 family protein [Caballeronia sp. BR00000012568055]
MSPAAIIHGTPTWVWVLLVFLLMRGFKAMKPGTTPLSKLAIIPLIFAGMGLSHLAGLSDGLVWIVTAAIGIVLGMVIAARTHFVVDPNARTVTLAGSIVPMVLIVATFAAKFWLGFETATATDAASLAMYLQIGAAVSGLVAGIFAGRFLTYWKVMNAQRALTA